MGRGLAVPSKRASEVSRFSFKKSLLQERRILERRRDSWREKT